MCDRRYYDEDLQSECCPEQPVCDTCWKIRVQQTFKDYVIWENKLLAQLQEKGIVPKFKDRQERVRPVPEPEVPVPEGTCSIYELTMTSPDDDVYYLRQSLQKIVESRMFEVIAWKACIELTKAGLPHIHAILYSKKDFLDASKLKTKFKHRAEMVKVRSHANYLNYMKKEDGNAIIADYCQKKGIPQFWDGLPKEV